ncbi:hypothetical protein [Streptomyces sp. SYSU K21746]
MAQSLTDLSDHRVVVMAVAAFDDSVQQADAARLLGLQLDNTTDYPAAAIDVSVDDVPLRVFANAAADGPHLTSDLANAIADVAQEYLGSEPFPPCPGHAHPMAVSVGNGRVFWCCPHDRDTARWELSLSEL